jgi:dTDP-4-amino-4,6-dideoxygalactose transaminase
MISTDFAPNETLSDAWLSLKLLFQPWRWKYGKELHEVKQKLLNNFLITNYACLPARQGLRIFFFLTGRAALNTILRSLQLPKDSEVIVQAFTCEAVILPILANKLKPVYVDIEKLSFSMNPIDLEKKITDKAKVLILQHSFGMTPVHRDRILSLVKKHQLLLIEDIAHGYSMKKSQESKVKSQKSVLLMSFGRSKALSSVFGGAVVFPPTFAKATVGKQFNNEVKKMTLPTNWFIFRLLLYKPLSVLIKSTYDIYIGKMLHKLINWLNLLIPEISKKEKRGDYDQILDKAYPNALAILLNHQLDRFEQTQQIRAQACAFYSHQPASPAGRQTVTNFSLLRFPLLVNNRDLITKQVAKNNVFLGRWYDQVVAPKSLNLKKTDYKLGSCPVAEEVCQKIINLPTNISLKEVKEIVKILACS